MPPAQAAPTAPRDRSTRHTHGAVLLPSPSWPCFPPAPHQTARRDTYTATHTPYRTARCTVADRTLPSPTTTAPALHPNAFQSPSTAPASKSFQLAHRECSLHPLVAPGFPARSHPPQSENGH